MDNTDNNHDEIMTLADLAQYLKISERSVLRMIKRNEIPVIRLASQWRFSRTVINDWLISNMQFPATPGESPAKQELSVIQLSRLTSEKQILCDITAGTKREILTQLIRPLHQNNIIEDEKKYLDLLLHREAMVSTGLSRGIALPHIRNPREYPVPESTIVIGICRGGSDFAALDNIPTRLFFLVCADTETNHLKIISKISFLTKHDALIQNILDAHEPQRVLHQLIQFDQQTVFA